MADVDSDCDLVVGGEVQWDLVEAYFKGISFHDESVPAVEWSDKYFYDNYVVVCKINKQVTLSESLLAGKAFLNWYVGGNTPKYPSDVVMAIFFGMTTDGKNDLLMEKKLWEVPSEGVTLNSAGDVEKMTNIVYSSSVKGPIKTAGSSKTGASITSETITAWYNQIWKMLDYKDKITERILLHQKMTVNYLGFLAMTMLRLSTKDSASVSKHIYYQTQGSYETLWKLKVPIDKTYPPANTMLNRFSLLFARFSPNANKCLAALVYTYGMVELTRAKAVRSILRAGCLSSLRMTGLGCLHWTQKASEILQVEILKLLRYMAIGTQNNTVIAITSILRDYVDPDRKQFSWAWARIFANGAFLRLSIRRDPLFAAVMMAIVTDGDVTNPLWKISSFNIKEMSGIDKSTALGVAERIKIDVQETQAAGGTPKVPSIRKLGNHPQGM